MALPRFLVPGLSKLGAVSLPDEESHHASRVLRCAVGANIVLFDGMGHEADAAIAAIDKRSVQANIASIRFAPRDHDGKLHFAVSLPKGDRQRSTIEKLVELGVDSLVPIETARSVAMIKESQGDRLDRYVVEACKQSGRNRLMNIKPATDIESALEPFKGAGIWILHPEQWRSDTISIREANRICQENPQTQLLFLVGPEGGFTNEEVDLAVSAGARVLSLGERIQRVETAVSTAAVLGHCWLD